MTYVGQLENGVPMSPSKRGNGELRKRMEGMQVGQSFQTAYSNTAVHRMAHQFGIKCETRKVGDGQIRVWRVE
jgi:hypothetical protein